MAKSLLALVFLSLLVSSFFTVVLAEELETLPPTSPAPSPLHHPPTKSPSYPPSHPPHHHHHHHHHHPPSTAPSLPPHHHHYPPSPAPVHPPTHHHYPPSPAPVHPPTHHHYPPSTAPVHPPVPVVKPPVHPPVPVVKPPVHPPVPVVKPPVHPPVTGVKPPVHPPVPGVKPPVHAPIHAPAPVYHFPRSFVAVQGVVFVKSCHYAGLDTLLGAKPVDGAVVKLQCNNTRYKLVQTAKTDKNGYFYVEAPKSVTTFGAHKCNVVLVSAPKGLKPSNLHGGVTGSSLRPEKPFVSNKLPFVLYTAGPLAFEPNCPH